MSCVNPCLTLHINALIWLPDFKTIRPLSFLCISGELVITDILLFYYRMTTLVKLLRNEGFLAAVTHFDQRGAVRTSAPWKRITELLTKRFSQN